MPPSRLLALLLVGLPACLAVPASTAPAVDPGAAADAASATGVADAGATPHAARANDATADDATTEGESTDDAKLGDAKTDGAADGADAEAAAEDPGLTGDWGGARSWLADQGVQVEVSITSDTASVTSGGLRQRTTTQSLQQIKLDADLDKLLGWSRATAQAAWWSRPGRTLNDDVGDVQGTDVIDGPNRREVYQLWLELWPVADGLRVKAGKLEGFDDFAVVDAAAEFLNNGPAYSPTLDTLPSYPDSAYGALASVYPVADTWLSAGVYDGSAQAGVDTGTHGAGTLLGAPSDLFWIGETGRSWSRDASHLAGRAAVGGWEHTGEFLRFDGGMQHGARGAYAVFEQELWAVEPAVADDARGLTAFLQLGATDEDVLAVSRHVAAGLRWQGPFEGHADDVLGLAASRAGLSREPGAGFSAPDELALETYYRWQATPWLAVQPDLQLVRNPGGDATASNAVVAAVRFDVKL